MKTAVSIPDETYERAERLARKTNRSRSKLFSDALDEYIARHAGNELSEAVNAALDEIGEGRDGAFLSITAKHLRDIEW
jgi:predicted transcriptional regulator